MATEIWVNICSGNGLLPDGTKPLPGPMLTDHQLSPVTCMLGQFHKRFLNQELLKIRLKITYLKFHSNFPGANELNGLHQSSWQLLMPLPPTWHQAIYNNHADLMTPVSYHSCYSSLQNKYFVLLNIWTSNLANVFGPMEIFWDLNVLFIMMI